MVNINFKSIIIKGFRSIKNELIFKFDREPGLYFISGNNQSEPRLGSNGSGKSSIWDALSWVNFGKTVDGTFGEDVINWSLNTCEVIEHLTKDGVEATITRTQNPNKIQLQIGIGQVEIVDQPSLDAFLHLDHDRFIHCLIVGQFNATFLEHLPSEKLKMFSGIMPIEFWEQCSIAANKYVTSYATNSQILIERLRGLQGKQTDQKDRREALNANQKDWEGTRQAKILDLTRKADDFHLEIKKIEAVSKEQEDLLAKANEKRPLLAFDIERIQSNIKAITNQKDIWVNMWNHDSAQQTLLKEELKKWKLLTGKCPTCGQVILSTDTTESKIKALTKEIVSLNRLLHDTETKMFTLDLQIKVNEEKIQELKNKDDILLESIKEHTKAILQYTNSKDLKLQEIRQVRESIDANNSGINPYTTLLETLDAEIQTINSTIEQTSKELEDSNKNMNGVEYWVKGFKELRMWVISDALTALEIESNNALSELGLVDWNLKFQMERETKKGGLNKGFHTMVHSKEFTKDKYLPLKIWSGGEAQRLKLGGVIGFSSLIQNYTGVNFNISVWDEPSSYLSPEGIEDLIEFLANQAEINQKAIYFIDQRHLEASKFKSVFKMIKTKDGSYMEELC